MVEEPSKTSSPPTWLKWVRDAVLGVDGTGAIVWSNPGAELFFGRTAEALGGMSFQDLLQDPEVAGQVFEDLRKCEDPAFACVVDLAGPAGAVVPIELTFTREGDGWFLIAQSHLEEGDESERMAFQAIQLSSRISDLQGEIHGLSAELLDKTFQLSREKNKMEAVLASMGEGLLVLDPKGVVQQINEAAGRILDTDPKKTLGESLSRFPPGTKIATLSNFLIQMLTEETDADDGPSGTRLQVQDRVLELSLGPIRRREGDSREDEGGTVVNLRDVTRRAEIDRMKDELVSIVSHELRAPLANITGYLDLVLSDDTQPLNEEQSNFLKVAHKNSVKLADLVDDMLDLSRLESGKIEMDLSELDIEYLVNFSHLSFRNEAESRNIELTKEVVGDPKIRGDIDRLQQVLNNLVSNAIKYTPDGGEVSISAKKEGNEVTIEIRDTGIGIKPEDQARLFQRFFRVRSHETRKIRGTGLGLSIAKTIVDAHGGRLTATSEHGKGSCFTVVLPA